MWMLNNKCMKRWHIRWTVVDGPYCGALAPEGSYLRGRPRLRCLLFTNSASSTIQKEPKSSSYRTKHLCRDRLVRIAFYNSSLFNTFHITVIILQNESQAQIVVSFMQDRWRWDRDGSSGLLVILAPKPTNTHNPKYNQYTFKCNDIIFWLSRYLQNSKSTTQIIWKFKSETRKTFIYTIRVNN